MEIDISPPELADQFHVMECRRSPRANAWIPQNPGKAPCLGQVPSKQKRAAIEDELHETAVRRPPAGSTPQQI
jgi:hypothetical protein